MKKKSRYEKIILDIFEQNYNGQEEFEFERSEITESCKRLGIDPPKNLGDVIYTFRYRRSLPQSILDTQPPGRNWLILGAGDANYRFRLGRLATIVPAQGMMVRKIPDATPEIISKYALSDEQALSTSYRYRRREEMIVWELFKPYRTRCFVKRKNGTGTA